jgi:hypothetical protein
MIAWHLLLPLRCSKPLRLLLLHLEGVLRL